LALDKGYYKKEGLDVAIDESAGSLEAIERVSSGAYDMGFADIH
jgi:NitT/TauT family transport system substrate-binding protein